MQDWLDELAASEPDVEWLQTAAGPHIEFDLRPWHELYWDAWEALRFDRFYGAMGGEGPISYQALSAYARDHAIFGAEFRVFRAFMGAIDAEWLKYQAGQSEG